MTKSERASMVHPANFHLHVVIALEHIQTQLDKEHPRKNASVVKRLREIHDILYFEIEHGVLQQYR
jgi:hypothetical protein